MARRCFDDISESSKCLFLLLRSPVLNDMPRQSGIFTALRTIGCTRTDRSPDLNAKQSRHSRADSRPGRMRGNISATL